MAIPLVLGILDRIKPIGIDNNIYLMIICSVIFQFSLTHGYVPYGSSDIILPTLVIICFILEFSPYFGGAVDVGEYELWFQVILCVGLGALFRACDIAYVKHLHAPVQDTKTHLNTFRTLILVCVLIIGIFANLLSLTNRYILLCSGCLLVVVAYPHTGHVMWHFGSAYALFGWWFMYRLRPSDPDPMTLLPTGMNPCIHHLCHCTSV